MFSVLMFYSPPLLIFGPPFALLSLVFWYNNSRSLYLGRLRTVLDQTLQCSSIYPVFLLYLMRIVFAPFSEILTFFLLYRFFKFLIFYNFYLLLNFVFLSFTLTTFVFIVIIIIIQAKLNINKNNTDNAKFK